MLVIFFFVFFVNVINMIINLISLFSSQDVLWTSTEESDEPKNTSPSSVKTTTPHRSLRLRHGR